MCYRGFYVEEKSFWGINFSMWQNVISLAKNAFSQIKLHSENLKCLNIFKITWVDRLKCLSSLAFCFRINSACSSLDAIGADELEMLINCCKCLSLSIGETFLYLTYYRLLLLSDSISLVFRCPSGSFGLGVGDGVFIESLALVFVLKLAELDCSFDLIASLTPLALRPARRLYVDDSFWLDEVPHLDLIVWILN